MFLQKKRTLLLLIFVVGWNILMMQLILVGTFKSNSSMKANLKTTQQELNNSLQYNRKLQKKLNNLKVKDNWRKGELCGIPCLQYETTRRRVRTNILEIWYYVNHELSKLKLQAQIGSIIEYMREQMFGLIDCMDKLRRTDGAEHWREQESKALSEFMQERLYSIQNPKNCSNAKRLLCKMSSLCGFTCQLHLLLHCFIVAHGKSRTLLLESHNWQQLSQGWQQIFLPLSETCVNQTVKTKLTDIQSQTNEPFVYLPVFESGLYLQVFKPQAVCVAQAKRLMRLHGFPIVWWVGQYFKYMLRPQIETIFAYGLILEQLKWRRPIVGVHVRRTDKLGNEASYHDLHEYMQFVEDYFRALEINGTTVERRIFLATDDATVITEARKNYTQYEIIANQNNARIAAKVTERDTNIALSTIIIDLYLLSISDFIVCTLSSTICRTAYALMQTRYVDATDRIKSLDDIYFCGDENHHYWQVIVPHKPRKMNEIALQTGDFVKVVGNHWDGFSKGTNQRTNQTGLFPSFKVINTVDTISMEAFQSK